MFRTANRYFPYWGVGNTVQTLYVRIKLNRCKPTSDKWNPLRWAWDCGIHCNCANISCPHFNSNLVRKTNWTGQHCPYRNSKCQNIIHLFTCSQMFGFSQCVLILWWATFIDLTTLTSNEHVKYPTAPCVTVLIKAYPFNGILVSPWIKNIFWKKKKFKQKYCFMFLQQCALIRMSEINMMKTDLAL